ncbi:transglycosylase family protein [Streptomyces sp. NPDC052051]|uniref:transglycosylase family protein n=1 Tax=Streptomyces sp. NPDC052051 TaxID=3154649 RepID=UPI003445E2E6
MLPGNGRHRRRRQAPAILVAAGVTGSAIAIPLLGATGASAAGATTWDQVAECESGGSWSADTGNGRYGGLQLTQSAWEKYGGLDYAPRADQASRSQQIAVAERILSHRGTSAWQSCAPLAGLTKHSGETQVDTGVANDPSSSPHTSGSDFGAANDPGLPDMPGSPKSTPLPPTSSPSPSTSESSPESSPSSDPTTVPSGQGTETSGAQESGEPSGKATKQAEPGKSTRETATSGKGAHRASGGGRHRGGSADEHGANGRGGDGFGRHASPDSSAPHGATDGSYTVRPGDTLSAIADSLELHGGWSGLYDVNKKAIGSDPDLILPGQSLALEDGHTAKKH